VLNFSRNTELSLTQFFTLEVGDNCKVSSDVQA
jgi:hypothetical protein